MSVALCATDILLKIYTTFEVYTFLSIVLVADHFRMYRCKVKVSGLIKTTPCNDHFSVAGFFE
jgi:hypothetical protein